MTGKTTAERQAETRERDEAKGLVRYERKIHKFDVKTLDRVVAWLRERREAREVDDG